jgi:hypothetical protein
MTPNENGYSVDNILQAVTTLDSGAKRYVFSEALRSNSIDEVLDITRSVTLDSLRRIEWDALDPTDERRFGERIGYFVSDVAQSASVDYQLQAADRIKRNLGFPDYKFDPEAAAQEFAFRLQQASEQRVSRVVMAFIAVFVLITIALLGAVVWKPESAQYVATVFTSVLGALAGFISGRTTSPAGTLPSVGSQQPSQPIGGPPTGR